MENKEINSDSVCERDLVLSTLSNLGQAYRLSLIASCIALSADKIISFFRVEDSPPQVNSKSVLAHEMELGPRAYGPGDHGPCFETDRKDCT